MDHYQFVFEKIAEDRKELLIALLDDIGFEGFEEEAQLLKAFVPADKFNLTLFKNIIKDNPVNYSKSIITEINWNEKWEAGFEPVMVLHPVSLAAFASVRASFHTPVKAVHDLIITPKMSFGTGHHATTFLMIQQMSLLDFNGRSVIDFGTGTGVLAILAEKLGASAVAGIDNDDWSIDNAKENIAANACSKIDIVKAGTIELKASADIILANINLNIIIASLDAVKAACKPGAAVLFSGVMMNDKEQLIKILEEKGFAVKDCSSKDNWLVILAEG